MAFVTEATLEATMFFGDAMRAEITLDAEKHGYRTLVLGGFLPGRFKLYATPEQLKELGDLINTHLQMHPVR